MPPKEIRIIKKQIKNMYIRIQPDKTIVVTAPLSASREIIARFIARQEKWILRTLDKIPEPVRHTYGENELHTYLGRTLPLHIETGPHNGVFIQSECIHMIIQSAQTDKEKLFTSAMKKELSKILLQYINHWSPIMKVSPAAFSIRKMRSRWGSCSYQTGRLHFSLDLISKPLPCIESVVVHELNHLLEPSHSPRFHSLMAHWLPDYKERKAALNQAKKEFF